MAKRFYQIAYEFGVAPRRLIAELSAVGLSVGNQMILVQPALEQRIRTLYDSLHPSADAPEQDAIQEDATATAVLEGETEETYEPAAGESAGETEATEEEVEEIPEEGAVATQAPAPEAPAPVAPHAVPPRVEPAHPRPEHGHPRVAESQPAVLPSRPAATPVAPAPETSRPAIAASAPAGAVAGPATAVKPAHPTTHPAGHTAGHAAGHTAAHPTAHPAGHTAAHPGAKPAHPVAPTATKPPHSGPGGSAPVTGTAAPVRPPVRMVQPKARPHAELVPTIDPRAGRLLKEAPKAPIPGVTAPRVAPGRPPAPGRPGDLNPALAKQAPAPGARRDSRSRDSVGGDTSTGRGAERHGKQTFQLRSRKRMADRPDPTVPQVPKTIEVTPPVSVKQFSEVGGLKISDIVKTMLLKHKQVVTPNSMLDEDTLVILGVEFDRDIRFVKKETTEDTMVKEAEVASSPEALVQRPPVVVVMGHVDHGKTSLLDYIRKADVAAHEAGGITQHIGAYQVTLPTGKKITFFDTPGHEAFTEMRRRGAKVTDIVVLVVAADDGVMPQTIEAIDHAKAAEVPIAIAITKADKVGFAQDRIDRVKQQLSQHGILVTGWGGDVETFPVASTGTQAGKGIDKLLEHIVLVAEVEDLKADPARNATGTIVEAENNPGRGVLATLLVENGTLRRGDALVAGSAWGRVRSMRDDKGEIVDEAPPGTPVEITGLEEVPEVGKPFFVRSDANQAREVADERKTRERELELAAQAKPASVENLFSQIEQEKVKALKVILKTDVQGSLEAIKARLDALGNEEVKVRVIRAGVGAVSESDVTMAATYNAQVVGFHVVADETARMKAKHLGVEIRMYRIIYELEEALRAVLEGKLAPESRETILGHAEILQIFRSTKLGNIAGCRVRDGLIRRDASIRLARGGIVAWEGRIGSLRREKDDAREVKEGFECGIRLEGYDDIKEGDVIEAYTVEQVARTLAS